MHDLSDKLFDDAPCGLVIARTDGIIVSANATFCAWVGFETGAIVGVKRVSDLLPVGGRIFHQTHWGPLLQIQRSVAEVQLDIVSASGKKLPMLLNVRRVDETGDERDFYAFMLVADRRIYEQELLRARKSAESAQLALEANNQALSDVARQKTEFLAVLSHELRNPLSSIQVAAEVLASGRASDEQMQRMRGALSRQVDVLTRLISDLWDLARITQGHLDVRKERVDLTSILTDLAEGLRQSIEEKNIRFDVELPDAPVLIDGDPVRIRQMVSNLVSNSRKFTDAGGTITLTLRSDGEMASIFVRDSGIGIASDKLARVFEMFAQVQSATARSQGLGIGLALVKSLALAHGGDVSAYSDGAGKGSEFVVSFPIASDARAQRA